VSTQLAVEAVDLVKKFGDTVAVDGVSFVVPEGTVLGLLGPNGAGKTTTVRMLTTLSVPTSGTGRVAGHDILTAPDQVRRSMGLTGQAATVDELLTARENLWLIGRLAGLPRRSIRPIGDDLLERFSLTEAADRTVKTYSGGMRRRLDLGAAIIPEPPVVFLDEPTTGLDPKGRLSMWDLIAGLARGGTTVLMTTQYLEEADRLADDIVVIDHGTAIARGTADALKRQVGGERLEVIVSDVPFLDAARQVLEALGEGAAHVNEQDRRVSVSVGSHDGVLTRAIRELDAAGVHVDDIGFRRPTLDEVFLTLTGHVAEDKPAEVEG
jgi:ABC-2 type transport system ATP-binding protein